MMRLATGLLLAVVMAVAGTPKAARAQDTTATANLRPTPDSAVVVLVLRDGSTLIGRVLEVTATTVRFASAVGESAIPRDAIREVRISARSALRDGEVWPEDPSRTRLFFAPTGRMMRQGEAYFADAYVLLPSIQVGLSDYFSIGGGFSLIPGVDIDQQVFYVTPKVGVYQSRSLNVSVGALVAAVKEISDKSPFGTVYGVGTIGGDDASFTAGAGLGFAGSTASPNAVIMVGGSVRTTRNIGLLTENYFYTGGGSSGLLSAGVRFMSEKIAVDLAGFTTTSLSGFPVPYVSFLYKF